MPRPSSLRRSLAAPAAVAATSLLLVIAPTAGAQAATPSGLHHVTRTTDGNLPAGSAAPAACGRRTAAVACAGTTGATGGSGTFAPGASPGVRAFGPYSVTAYETVNIRTSPTTSSRAFDRIRAGETRTDALCWAHGETIRDHGYTNDVWIGFTEGWASAVYLKGDAYAGLPADAAC